MNLSDALAATQTTLLASQFNGGFIRLFSGPKPATPGDSETGALLGVVTVNAAAGAGLHFNASGSALQKSPESWVFKALSTGTVGWFRLVQAGDTGGADINALRIDGSVGGPSEPTDMNWETLSVVADQVYTIDSFVYFIQPV